MTWNAPTQSWDTPAAPPRRRHRALRNTIIVVLALIVLFIVGDRLAVLYAQNQVAQQFKEQGGFEGTPSVSIKGFPFLTQVIAHNIHEITITSDKIKAGPVTITNLDANITDVKLNGAFTAGTIGHLDGQALIPFSGLTNALGSALGGAGGGLGDLLGSGVTIKSAGHNTIKASFDLTIVSGSATLKVTREPGNKIHIHLLSSQRAAVRDHRSAEGPDRADPGAAAGHEDPAHPGERGRHQHPRHRQQREVHQLAS